MASHAEQRTRFLGVLDVEISRHADAVVVFRLDLDRFSRIRQTFDPDVARLVHRELVRRMEAFVAPAGALLAFGTDSFAGITRLDEATAERLEDLGMNIIGSVSAPVVLPGKPPRLVNDVLKQAKMSQSLLTVAGTRPAPATHGYIGTRYGSVAAQVNPSLSASTDVTAWPTTWGREGGGAYSTIGDLAAWAKLCVGDGLLDDAMVAARHKTHEIDAGDYGMGIVKTRTWWGHEGQTVGCEATAQCNPKTGEYVAIAVNSSTGLVGALGTVGRAAAPAFVKQWVLAEFT